MTQVTNWFLIVLGAVLVLVEVLLGAATGFDFLLIGSAILLGGVLGFVFGSSAVGVASAGILSLLYVFIGRRRIRSKLGRHGVPTNVDALLGKTVQVVEAITPGRPGRIKFEGEEWRAVSDEPGAGPIEEGRRVRVVRLDGVTAYVAPEPAGSSPGGASS